MKTVKLLLASIVTVLSTNIYGQEQEQEVQNLPNKWSLELNAGSSGFNTLGQKTLITEKYFSDTFTPFHVNVGVRYMASSIFGFKASLAYDNIKEGNKSQKFTATYIGVRGELIFNLAKFFQFNQFTKRFGLLAHGGIGYSKFMIDESLASSTATYYKENNSDNIITGLAGITIPVRLTNKLFLNLDGTLVAQGKHQLGLSGDKNGDGGVVDATIFNATIGFTYSLGKGSVHTDWTDYKEEIASNPKNEEVEALKQRIDALESNNNNNKGVDMAAIQKMINDKAGKDTQKQQDIAKDLINNGYIASYFEYNVAKPTNESTEGIDFVLNYLRKNPTSNVVVTGYADEKGTAEYNDKLALKRANNVKETLEKGGVSASRIAVVSGAQDKSVDADSEWARNTVRKVLFKIQ